MTKRKQPQSTEPGEEELTGQPAMPDMAPPVMDAPGNRIMLSEDIEIFPTRPRDDLGYEGVRVYEAKDRRVVSEQVAVICGRGIVPRLTNVASYRHIKNPNVLKLVDAGIVDWKPESRQRFAMVFERPPNKKLLSSPEDKPYHLSEDGVLTSFLHPLLSVLSDLKNIDLVHGAINPMNIFFSGTEGTETVMLGECLSCAPSYRQNPLFEPVERALAQPPGRGQGTSKDDLYALGVCVAMAARRQNFLLGKTHEQIIHEKLSQGTYALVIGRERMPSGLSEFLRGVLNDDESQRWDVDDALRWMEGRRLSPKQSRARLHAARPFVFKDEKYWDLNAIAEAFSKSVADAAVAVEQDQFDLWIKRNFEDKLLLKRLEEVWEKEKGGNRERLVTSVCMVLDPGGPVRYKNLSLFPGGYGNALADAVARGEDLQPYGEIISQQFFSMWINQRFDEIPDAPGLASQIERCRNYLTQKIPGYGMERVLYTLSRECVCMSPLLKDFFVINPGRMLMALEHISRRADRPENVLDRHMIAFLSVREPKMVDPYLGHITSHDRGNQVVGIVRALSAIQRRFSINSVPGVTNWMVSLSAPAVEKFNDRELREMLSRGLEKVRDSGNLTLVLELIDDLRVVQEDTQRFNIARMEYMALTREKEILQGHLRKRKIFGRATGRQVAMLVSSFLAFLCIGGYLAFYFMQGVR